MEKFFSDYRTGSTGSPDIYYRGAISPNSVILGTFGDMGTKIIFFVQKMKKA
jgi:hypothetical protein